MPVDMRLCLPLIDFPLVDGMRLCLPLIDFPLVDSMIKFLGISQVSWLGHSKL